MTSDELSEEESRRSEDLSLQLYLQATDPVQPFPRLDPDAPNVLHYTTGEGLLGILSGDSLRLTHSSYLNDPGEQTYPATVARQCLLDRVQTEPQARLRDIYAGAANAIGSMQRVFVASFCGSNLLNQWRVYCPNGGYALEFSGGLNVHRLKLALTALPIPLYRRVEYDPVTQLTEFSRTIDELAFTWESSRQDFEAELGSDLFDRACCSFLRGQLQFFGLYHKSPAFAVEEEWRLALRLLDARHLSFRHRNGLLIPQFDWSPSGQGGARLPLVKVWIGPRNDRELDAPAVQLLLQRYGYASSAAEAASMVAVAPFQVR